MRQTSSCQPKERERKKKRCKNETAFPSDYQAYQSWKGGVDETGGDNVKREDESDGVTK